MRRNLGTTEKNQTLRAVPLLAPCTDRELDGVTALTTEVDVHAGQALCERGERGVEFFVLLDGVADVVRASGVSSSATQSPVAMPTRIRSGISAFRALWRCESCWMEMDASSAEPADGNTAMIPSPRFFTSVPPWAPIDVRSSSKCVRRTSSAAAALSRVLSSVEPTRSVKTTVAATVRPSSPAAATGADHRSPSRCGRRRSVGAAQASTSPSRPVGGVGVDRGAGPSQSPSRRRSRWAGSHRHPGGGGAS